MFKGKRNVASVLFVLAVWLGLVNVVEAAVPGSERLAILKDVMYDSIKILQLSTRLTGAALDFKNGIISETDTFRTATELFYEAKFLSDKANARFEQFAEKYPPGDNTTEDDLKLLRIVMASQGQASSFLRATMVAMERFRPRDEELSDADRKALEELLLVYDTLASVRGDLVMVWIELVQRSST